MNRIICAFAALATVAVLIGCSTPKTVAAKRGLGTKQVYHAGYDQVWRAAVDATQLGDLHVLQADRAAGFISAKRGLRIETFGENVAVWVTRISPTETEVEVVSRQAGPPKFWFKNWEKEIHQAIAANLTKEDATAVGTPGVDTLRERGTGASDLPLR